MVLKDLTVIIGINRVFFSSTYMTFSWLSPLNQKMEARTRLSDKTTYLTSSWLSPLNQEMEARTRLSDKTTYLTSSWLSPLNQEREVRTRLSPFLLLYQNLILLYVD